ncbi:MAG: competence type IV pilus major pilin ComGC [Fastidiosipilaceae bacterium]|jgi:prepilin-type N-terminal cleavage/methylation domain-containing protein
MEKICKMLKRNNKGFTLVELMIVVLIIGILVAIAIPVYNTAQENAKKTACQANLRTLDGAAAQYEAEEGVWPNNVNNLVNKGYIKKEPTCPANKSAKYVWDGTNNAFQCNHDSTNHVYP